MYQGAQSPEDRAGISDRLLVMIFIGIPLLALLSAIYVLWGPGINLADLVLAIFMYVITAHGISIGFHRLFTHNGFKASRALRIVLACLGTMAIEGDVISWAADHRRHHQYSDKPGDPHSPWRFGKGPAALAKGMIWAHIGWMFRSEKTNFSRYVPDLMRDKDLVRITRLQPVLVMISLAAPALIDGLVSWSWRGVAAGFFWAGLVRIGLLHHVTFSINSICHAFGRRLYNSRDRSGNVWWLALPSAGEAWHNYHHADPTSARHGVLRSQVDTSARVIWLFERAGWVHDVRWPDGQRIRARLLPELALSANLPDRQDEGGTGQGQQRSEGEEQRVA